MPSDDARDLGGETSQILGRGDDSAAITINVKSLCGDDFQMAIPRDIVVSDLKTRIRERVHVEEGRQRLIYRGRLLVDAEPLSTYKVEDGHFLHMVARPVGAQVQLDGSPNNAASSPVRASPAMPANENGNRTTANETTTTNQRAETLGQRLLMGMGVPMVGPTVPSGAGGATTGAGAGNGVETALLNAATGLDDGQLLSNMLGLAGAGATTGTAGTHTQQDRSLWNGAEGRAVRAQARETGAGVTPGGSTVGGPRRAGAAGREEGDDPSQTDLEHVRQGLLTMHTLLSGTNNTRRGTRVGVVESGVSAASAADRTRSQEEKRDLAISNPSSPADLQATGATASNAGRETDSPEETSEPGAKGAAAGAGEDAAEKEQSSISQRGAMGTVDLPPRGDILSNGLAEEDRHDGGRRPRESDQNGAGKRATSTPPVTQRWPFARVIGRGSERPSTSESTGDVGSGSALPESPPGLVSSSGESDISEEDGHGASCPRDGARRAGAGPDGVHERSYPRGTAQYEEEEKEQQAEGEGGVRHRTMVSRKFFVGQWLDVKDTVNNWLEATVMDIADHGTRLQIHYNGWPPRWDEWLNWDSPRIAPFRTRTQHLPHAQHVSPTPVSAVRNAPITGIDDVRVVMPEVSRVMKEICPMVEELSACCARNLERDTSSGTPGERSLSNTLPWTRQRVQRSHDSQDGANPANSAPDGATIGEICPKAAEFAADVAPLLDRLGRTLTDVAPHLARLGSRQSRQATANAGSSAEGEVSGEPGEVQAGGGSRRRVASQLGGGRRPRGSVQASRTRSRSPEGRAAAAFRQLVSTSNPAPTSSNINIHIHAIVPLRAPPSPSPPPPPPPPTASASAVATPTRADRPPLAVAGSRNSPWGNGVDAAGASASLIAAARAAAASRAVRDSDTPEGSTPRSHSRGVATESPRSGARAIATVGDDAMSTISAGTPSVMGISRSASVASSASFDVAVVGASGSGGSAEERAAESALHGVSTPGFSAVAQSDPEESRSSGDPDGGAPGSDQSPGSDGSASINGAAGPRRQGGWRHFLRTFVGGNGSSRVNGRREGGEGDVTP